MTVPGFFQKFEVVREKFQVASNNLFPCQADPKKCMYIFPEKCAQAE